MVTDEELCEDYIRPFPLRPPPLELHLPPLPPSPHDMEEEIYEEQPRVFSADLLYDKPPDEDIYVTLPRSLPHTPTDSPSHSSPTPFPGSSPLCQDIYEYVSPAEISVHQIDDKPPDKSVKSMMDTLSHDQLDLLVKMLQQVTMGSQPVQQSPTHSEEGASPEEPKFNLQTAQRSLRK